MSDRDDDMTLAFSLRAAERLADPEAAFADARQWSTYLGVVSQEPHGAERFVRSNELPQDFFTGTRGLAESLGMLREQFKTERHVFVGDGENDQRLADSMDWEYRSIEEAAERAGWDLASSESLLDRVRGLFDRS